ncbi:hypothetical protein JZ751_025452 [Albula glossodonta]|uniref:Uncharacterized protein n=1 Tax=Albula glossodonta TaxID=121402 RepID=A0A8T2NF38_9TELE|nr:hypothetical protein JZ751_025452 [Albula glossodonta]
MSQHHHQRGPHSRALSAEERSSSPAPRTSTPTHKSSYSSSSSHRDSRQRFFVLDNGILKYTKSPIDIQKGKLHGSIDVGLSVMSIKKRARRIDLDTEEHIYHLKNEIVRSPRDASLRTFPPPTTPESPQPPPPAAHDAKAKPSSLPWPPSRPPSSSLPTSYSNGQSKVAAWLQESEEMDKCAEELSNCQSSLSELSRLLKNLEILQRTQSAPNFTDMQVGWDAV